MGAWGHQSFENDTALDWVLTLSDSNDASLLNTSLDAVQSEQEEYLDADVCAEAISAAEIVAALNGKASNELPEEVNAWLRGKQHTSDDLKTRAKTAVAAVLEDSELKELWEETEYFADWKATMEDLQSRLN